MLCCNFQFMYLGLCVDTKRAFWGLLLAHTLSARWLGWRCRLPVELRHSWTIVTVLNDNLKKKIKKGKAMQTKKRTPKSWNRASVEQKACNKGITLTVYTGARVRPTHKQHGCFAVLVQAARSFGAGYGKGPEHSSPQLPRVCLAGLLESAWFAGLCVQSHHAHQVGGGRIAFWVILTTLHPVFCGYEAYSSLYLSERYSL